MGRDLIIYKQHFEPPPNLYSVIDRCLKDETTKQPHGFYTTYFQTNNPQAVHAPILNYYEDRIKDIKHMLGLQHSYINIRTHNQLWLQIYPPNMDQTIGHDMHHHFQGFELFSWVHFVQPTDAKCFKFNNYIDNHTEQSGEFIIFPSWAIHYVLPNKSKDSRVIVAGNCVFDEFEFISPNGDIDHIIRG